MSNASMFVSTCPVHGIHGHVSLPHPVSGQELTRQFTAEEQKLVERMTVLIKQTNGFRHTPTHIADEMNLILAKLATTSYRAVRKLQAESN